MTNELSYDDVMQRLPTILADCLAIDPEDVTPTAGFFAELGGDSIDLLDLSFRCEKAFGIKSPFWLFHGSKDKLTLDDGEFLSAEAIRLVRETYPFFAEHLDQLERDRFRNQDLKDSFTVEAIAQFVIHAATAPAAAGLPPA